MRTINFSTYEINDCIRLLEKLKKLEKKQINKKAVNEGNFTLAQYVMDMEKINNLIQRLNGKKLNNEYLLQKGDLYD